MVYRANFPILKGPRAPSQNCKKKSLWVVDWNFYMAILVVDWDIRSGFSSIYWKNKKYCYVPVKGIINISTQINISSFWDNSL